MFNAESKGDVQVLLPSDYPKNNDSQDTTLDEVTYASLRDRAAANKPITNDMIRSAQINMEVARKPSTSSSVSVGPLTQLLGKLRSAKG